MINQKRLVNWTMTIGRNSSSADPEKKLTVLKWRRTINIKMDLSGWWSWRRKCSRCCQCRQCWYSQYHKCCWCRPRGIAQWIKHCPALWAVRVQTQTEPKILVLLSSRVPLTCALSLTQFLLLHAPARILVMGEVNERNHGKIQAAPSVRQGNRYMSNVLEKWV